MDCYFKYHPVLKMPFDKHPADWAVTGTETTIDVLCCADHLSFLLKSCVGVSIYLRATRRYIGVSCIVCGKQEKELTENLDAILDWKCDSCKWASWQPRETKRATIHPMDRPVVWEHPETGEIRHPGRNDVPMPEHYRVRGFERKEFTSYKEHQDFNRSQGLVNHAAEDIR